MKRANVLLCAAAIWLSPVGFVEISGQALGQGFPEDPNVKQFEQQFRGPFQQLYRTELHFIRLVSQPTKQQFEKIAADGEPVLKATIKKFAASMRNGRVTNQSQSDPRTPITDALAKSVRTILSPEQAARYQTELEQRAAARKRVVALSLVAKADRILVLTAEQREKLGKILGKNSTDSWNNTQMFMYGGQYFPQMPDAEILPILTDAQKTVWRGIQKGNVNFGFDMGMLQAIEIADEVWDDRPSPEKPVRADGKAAVKEKGTTKPVEKK